MNDQTTFDACELARALRVAGKFRHKGKAGTATLCADGSTARLIVGNSSGRFTARVKSSGGVGSAWNIDINAALKALGKKPQGDFVLPAALDVPVAYEKPHERRDDSKRPIYDGADMGGVKRAYRALQNIPETLHLVLSRFYFEVGEKTSIAALDGFKYGVYTFAGSKADSERFTLPACAVRSMIEADCAFTVYRMESSDENRFDLGIKLHGIGDIITTDYSHQFPNLDDSRLNIRGDYETVVIDCDVLGELCTEIIQSKSEKFRHVGIRVEGDDVLLYDMRDNWSGESPFFQGARYDRCKSGALVTIVDAAYLSTFLGSVPRLKEVEIKISGPTSIIEVVPVVESILPAGESVRFAVMPVSYDESVRNKKGE